MLYAILILTVVAIAGFLAIASLKPDTFRMERKTHVKAPPERIFPLIADFHEWPKWSPYEHRDPAMTRQIGGSPSGVGATYAWQGNKNVGSGRMEILEARPGKVLVKLDFLAPMKANNMAEFTMTPSAGGTDVTWAMFGPQPFLGKVMCTIFSMDKMVGGDFEKGLAAMKTAAESL